MENLSNKRVDNIFEAVLYCLLVFMPLTFGAVMPWSEQIVVILAAVIAFILFVQSFSWQTWRFQPAVLLAVLFCLIGGLQLIELPAAFINAVSPATFQTKSDLLSSLADSSGKLEKTSLSFYAHGTFAGLRLFGAVAVIFIAVLSYYTTLAKIKRLLTVIAVTGGAIGVLALLQDIMVADSIYWLVPIQHKYANSGTFVNHSNFGQFMNLSIGASLALIFILLRERFAGAEHSPRAVFEYLASQEGKKVLWLSGMIVVSVASIFISLTRGGMVALIVSGILTTLALTCSKTGRSKGWFMVLVGLLAFMCVLYVGFDAVYDRLATLEKVDKVTSDRMQIISDIIGMSKKFPIFGTGLGSHPYIYPVFDSSNITSLAYHAENEYAQVLEEMGMLGLMLLVIFAVIIANAYFRCIKRIDIKGAAGYAAYGLGFGILAILIQSLSDFGQHLPANGMLTAVSCAVVLAISQMEKPQKELAKKSRIVFSALILAVGAVFIIFTFQANSHRLAWDNYVKARDIERILADNGWQGSQAQYTDMIRYADEAVKQTPGNVSFRHWLNVYRWRMLSQQIAALDVLDVKNEQLNEQIRGFIARLINEFENNIKLVPTYGTSWTMAGQLRYFVLGDKNGIDYINTGRKLAPCDPLTAYMAGLLDVKEYVKSGQSAKDAGYPGLAHFSRALELRGNYFKDIADLYIKQLNMPDAVVELCGDYVDRLSYVAAVLTASENPNTQLAEHARARIFELLLAKSQEINASASIFASIAAIYYKNGDIENSLMYYEKSLTLDYSQIGWRLKYAQILAQAGRKDDALHQARIILRIKPGYSPAVKFIEKVVTE